MSELSLVVYPYVQVGYYSNAVDTLQIVYLLRISLFMLNNYCTCVMQTYWDAVRHYIYAAVDSILPHHQPLIIREK